MSESDASYQANKAGRNDRGMMGHGDSVGWVVGWALRARDKCARTQCHESMRQGRIRNRMQERAEGRTGAARSGGPCSVCAPVLGQQTELLLGPEALQGTQDSTVVQDLAHPHPGGSLDPVTAPSAAPSDLRWTHFPPQLSGSCLSPALFLHITHHICDCLPLSYTRRFHRPWWSWAHVGGRKMAGSGRIGNS